jgi:hypothetical protein
MKVMGNSVGNRNLQKSCTFLPLGKKLQPTAVGCHFKKSFFTAGAVTFYLMVKKCNLSEDLVMAYVFQQLLCITYALTP